MLKKEELYKIEHDLLKIKINDYNSPGCMTEASVMSGEVKGIVEFVDTALSYIENIEVESENKFKELFNKYQNKSKEE